MIYDRLENLGRYLPDSDREAVLNFISEINADSAPAIIDLDDYIQVKVIETKTNFIQLRRIEAHRHHVDIQYTLKGRENIGIYDTNSLVSNTEYDTGKDVTFYQQGTMIATTLNVPGRFTLLEPNDAHQPQICIGEPEPVKKVVIKLRIRNGIE